MATPAELAAQLRGLANQSSDVVDLEAQLIELRGSVAPEGDTNV